MNTRHHLTFAFLALLTANALSACASVPTNPTERAEFEATDDPLEPMNRTIFSVNDWLDRNLLRPVAVAYRDYVPEFVRNRVSDILQNMAEPVIFANDLMQARVSDAATTVGRFGVNTTIGAAGMWDVASDWGMYKQTGDFGQTLNSWGINGGPYLVLPLFGPSNFRDAIGLGVDSVMSPWQYAAGIGGNGTENRFDIAYFVADGLTKRSDNIDSLDALRAGSLDFYAQMRSVYRQYRDKQLGNQPVNTPKYEDFQ